MRDGLFSNVRHDIRTTVLHQTEARLKTNQNYVAHLWQKGVEAFPLHLNLEFDHLLLSNHSYVALELLKQFDLCGVVV